MFGLPLECFAGGEKPQQNIRISGQRKIVKGKLSDHIKSEVARLNQQARDNNGVLTREGLHQALGVLGRLTSSMAGEHMKEEFGLIPMQGANYGILEPMNHPVPIGPNGGGGGQTNPTWVLPTGEEGKEKPKPGTTPTYLLPVEPEKPEDPPFLPPESDLRPIRPSIPPIPFHHPWDNTDPRYGPVPLPGPQGPEPFVEGISESSVRLFGGEDQYITPLQLRMAKRARERERKERESGSSTTGLSNGLWSSGSSLSGLSSGLGTSSSGPLSPWSTQTGSFSSTNNDILGSSGGGTIGSLSSGGIGGALATSSDQLGSTSYGGGFGTGRSQFDTPFWWKESSRLTSKGLAQHAEVMGRLYGGY